MKHLRLIVILFVWLPILLHRTGPESTTQADKTERAPVDFDEDRGDESDALLERIKLYLNRHGNNGRIDPQRRLETVRAEYRHRTAEESSRSISPQAVAGSHWVSLGPTNGAGRATAIATHPTDAGTLYIGAAGGGVWKTTDSGSSWTPLTDFVNDLSVGAVAIAPSSPNIIYVGTGEGGIAIDFIPGIGFLKSTDGGASWIFPSSVIASKFYRIVVHPTNPQELVAGTNAGGFRSTDGGANWTRVIDPNQYGDVADIVRNPSNAQILYAATWDELRWCARSGQCNIAAPRVLKSTDGGATWTEKSSGLPVASSTSRVNRFSLAISATNPSLLYLGTSILESPSATTEVSHIYKTLDAGESWTDLPGVSGNNDTNISQFMRTQGWYDNTIVVSPNDPNIVIAGGVTYIRSTDGGSTWGRPPLTGGSVHVDVHDLRYRGSTLYIANDGGIWSSPDNGQTAVARTDGLVTRQYYALALDPANRNRILGGMQDNGTNRRPDSGSTSWTGVIGGDGFECGVNSLASSFAYGTVQFGVVLRTKDAGATPLPPFTNITPPYAVGENGSFLSCLTIDPSQPSTIYTGTYRVWRSTNAGDLWEPLGTTTTDGTTFATNFRLTTIAVARTDSSVLMATRGNVVYRSTNGGLTWAGLSSGLPTNAGINNLEIDPTQPNIAYAAIAGTLGSRLYRTSDGGATWQPRSTGLPAFAAQVVRVDPTDTNVLFCGTDVGVYRSTDQGVSWLPFGTGLPNSSVHDLRILEDGSAVRVATHGRGIWELEVPPTGNTPPAASVTNPTTVLTVSRGSSVDFSGRVTDPDLGDSVVASWIFPDTWERVSAPLGISTVSHAFNAAGIFPVTLTARDSHGAIGSSAITIRVTDPDDVCSTPLVIPAAGPFPFSTTLNNETAETQASDPGPPCTPNLGRSRTLWLEFTPAATGTYEFSTCGTSVDTVLSVWTGSRCGPYTAVANACNDDAMAGSTCVGSLGSDLTVRIEGGQTVRIQASGVRSTEAGTFVLTVTRSLPKIISVSISGKNLLVAGTGFDDGADIFVDGVKQKTRSDELTPATALIGKKAGKKIARGATVTVQVHNSDGSLSNEFSFTRPA